MSMESVTVTINPAVFKTLVGSTCVLGAKMLVTNFWSGIAKDATGLGPPEDGKLRGMETSFDKPKTGGDDAAAKAKAAASMERYSRACRVVSNDLENIPLGLVVLWTAAMAIADEQSDTLVFWIQAFTLGRIVHSLTYLAGIPGVRSLAFMTGNAALIRAGYLAWISL